MKCGAFMFAAGFVASALSGWLGAGCFGGDCECPRTPERPAAQGPLRSLDVQSFDQTGNDAELEVKPESGTLEVTGDAVVIRYLQAGADHEIRYAVTGPAVY